MASNPTVPNSELPGQADRSGGGHTGILPGVMGLKKKATSDKKPAQSTPSSSNSGETDNDKTLGSFDKGGTVPKTGVYKVHEGEEVVPKGRASDYRKVFKSRGKAGLHNWK